MDEEKTVRLGAVFYVSLALSVAFIVWGVVSRQSLSVTSAAVLRIVVDTFGWMYVVVVLAVLVFVLMLALSGFGKIRLGGESERPEFGRVSWIAMLFSAGVGLSFLFWGTAEPLIHLADPPYGAAVAGSEEAARMGMRYSFLFWGLHAWAIYAAVALAVAHSSFRRGRPVLISSALYPLLGDRVYGSVGKAVDVMAVFAILFGVATSLGLGTRELNSGLNYAFGIPESYWIKVMIIAGLMTVSTISAATGLGRGIRVLSLLNFGLCGVLMLFVLFSGPMLFVLGTFADSVGSYFANFAQMSLNSESQADRSWAQQWTFFFWAWWISWAPFVGPFIARISRGRTIRELVLGVVLVPSVLSFVWFSIFGGTALQREFSGVVDVSTVAGQSKAVATFEVLGTLPLQAITSMVILVVLGLLFITSADSASFMLGSTTAGGSLKPPKLLKLMWSFGAAFAAVLLLEGGRQSLQGAAVITAVPFTVILVCLCVSLCKILLRERLAEKSRSSIG